MAADKQKLVEDFAGCALPPKPSAAGSGTRTFSAASGGGGNDELSFYEMVSAFDFTRATRTQALTTL